MTEKQAAPQSALIRVKTGLKAGKHCHNAFRDFVRNPNYRTEREFLDCCQKDNKCLQ